MHIYLDNLASTPPDPRVVAHQASTATELVGNPNSVEHAAGKRSLSVLEDARARTAASIGRDPEQVLFTPSASSALWLAVQDVANRAGPRPARVLASAIEHPTLLRHLADADRQRRIELTLFPVDISGQPDLAAVARLCRDGVDLLCMMAANNETGTIAPVAAIAELARAHGCRVLVDASQAAGRLPLRDLLSDEDQVVLSGAKIYGPRVGVLAGPLARRSREAVHGLFGTPDAAAASAMGMACSLRETEMVQDETRIADLRDLLQERLLAGVPGLAINGDTTRRLAGALHVSTPELPGDAVVARLWGKVDVSTGAACQSGAPGPSHVLTAMKLEPWRTEGAVRIGVGKFNDVDEIECAAEHLVHAMRAQPAQRRIHA